MVNRKMLILAVGIVSLLTVPVVALADHGPETEGTVTSAPTLAGTAAVGGTLTVAPGTWVTDEDAVVDGYLYQWMRCDATGANCNPIQGATSASYPVGSGDIGDTLRAQVTQVTSDSFADGGEGEGDGTGGERGGATLSQPGLSAPSDVVPAPATPPVSSGEPRITVEAPSGGAARIVGTSQVGDLLIASTGSWSGTGPITFTYQWLRCNAAGSRCVPIKGATGSTYRLTRRDAGHTVRVVVTAHNPVASVKAESSKTSSVQLVPILHVSELVRVLGGVVKVRVKGGSSYRTLSRASLVPDGSTVDTSSGSASLEVAADHNHHYYNAQVHGASFIVHQLHGEHPLTQFRLLGGNLRCPVVDPMLRRRPLAFTARRRPHHHGPVLWAHDNGGKFTTRGQYASAIVRGTTWTTTEECEGTLFHVIAGSIVVHDYVLHRNVVVKAGHSYLASAPEPAGTRQGV